MSAEARAAIAAAASTVDGVTCTPYYRQSLRPGEGCVQLVTRLRARIGWSVTWEVVIALPQELEAAEKWIDEHADLLAAALRPALHVTSITPGLSGGNPIVVIEGAREG